MSGNEDARMLLAAARNDLKALEGMLDDPDTFSDEVFGFHAQQAVEKCLKSWISLLGAEYPLTHGLNVLLLQLEELGCSVESYWGLIDLSSFGVTFRYTVLDDSETPLERLPILQKIRLLYRHVVEMMGR